MLADVTIEADVALRSPRSPGSVRREFVRRLDGELELVCDGAFSEDPRRLLEIGHGPKTRIDLFGFQIYLTYPRQNPDLRNFPE